MFFYKKLTTNMSGSGWGELIRTNKYKVTYGKTLQCILSLKRYSRICNKFKVKFFKMSSSNCARSRVIY